MQAYIWLFEGYLNAEVSPGSSLLARSNDRLFHRSEAIAAYVSFPPIPAVRANGSSGPIAAAKLGDLLGFIGMAAGELRDD